MVRGASAMGSASQRLTLPTPVPTSVQNAEAASVVHREAHGLVADEIYSVTEPTAGCEDETPPSFDAVFDETTVRHGAPSSRRVSSPKCEQSPAARAGAVTGLQAHEMKVAAGQLAASPNSASTIADRFDGLPRVRPRGRHSDLRTCVISEPARPRRSSAPARWRRLRSAWSVRWWVHVPSTGGLGA